MASYLTRIAEAGSRTDFNARPAAVPGPQLPGFVAAPAQDAERVGASPPPPARGTHSGSREVNASPPAAVVSAEAPDASRPAVPPAPVAAEQPSPPLINQPVAAASPARAPLPSDDYPAPPARPAPAMSVPPDAPVDVPGAVPERAAITLPMAAAPGIAPATTPYAPPPTPERDAPEPPLAVSAHAGDPKPSSPEPVARQATSASRARLLPPDQPRVPKILVPRDEPASPRPLPPRPSPANTAAGASSTPPPVIAAASRAEAARVSAWVAFEASPAPPPLAPPAASRISIGRIDVQTTPAPPAAASPRPRAQPGASLRDGLNARFLGRFGLQ